MYYQKKYVKNNKTTWNVLLRVFTGT